MIEIEKKAAESARLLDVKHLRTSFFTNDGEVKAVDDISYYINKQEVIALVGESGCGKSVSQLSVMQLIQEPPGKIIGGEIILNGQNLLEYSPKSKEIRKIRGAKISMIFQEPMTSLNPVYTIGSQLSEVIRVHMRVGKKEAWGRGIKTLESVGISDVDKRMKNFPFELSGGMRQRVMIATSVACHSDLIIADELTTALDVTTQAQVMDLLLSVVKELGTALLVVTHNLGLVTRYAERIYVMYAGKIIESGTTEDILTCPMHPYTIGLLKSIPRLDVEQAKKLDPIAGDPPNLIDLPPRCTFLPRCQYAHEECRLKPFPDLRCVGQSQHCVACHLDLRSIKNG